MNYSDTERMETYIEALGYTKTDTDAQADLIIFNTCSIRQKAEDKVFGKLKEIAVIKRTKPDLTVVITGCMVRKSTSRYSEKRDKIFHRTRDVDICLRIEELPLLADLMREINPESKIQAIPEESLEHYFSIGSTYSTTAKNQAFLPISTGCDKFCTYCIVPFSRGREQSRPMQDILDEAEKLVDQGFKEITLIGQTVNSYGVSVHDKINKKFDYLPEGKEPFTYLLEKIDELKDRGLARVRWTSSHPKDMTDQLITAMATLKTQMPYLHLPVQAGDNVLLKRMNRPYTVEKYAEIIKKLREQIPDISITTDIIVGFSGETEEEFENTYNFFKEMQFEHGFPARYSERTGTYASKSLKDDISDEVKAQRWHKLNDYLKEKSKDVLSKFIGKTVNVLFEAEDDNYIFGRSEHFKNVNVKKSNATKDLIGQIIPVKITSSEQWDLFGTLE